MNESEVKQLIINSFGIEGKLKEEYVPNAREMVWCEYPGNMPLIEFLPFMENEDYLECLPFILVDLLETHPNDPSDQLGICEFIENFDGTRTGDSVTRFSNELFEGLTLQQEKAIYHWLLTARSWKDLVWGGDIEKIIDYWRERVLSNKKRK